MTGRAANSMCSLHILLQNFSCTLFQESRNKTSWLLHLIVKQVTLQTLFSFTWFKKFIQFKDSFLHILTLLYNHQVLRLVLLIAVPQLLTTPDRISHQTSNEALKLFSFHYSFQILFDLKCRKQLFGAALNPSSFTFTLRNSSRKATVDWIDSVWITSCNCHPDNETELLFLLSLLFYFTTFWGQ